MLLAEAAPRAHLLTHSWLLLTLSMETQVPGKGTVASRDQGSFKKYLNFECVLLPTHSSNQGSLPGLKCSNATSVQSLDDYKLCKHWQMLRLKNENKN